MMKNVFARAVVAAFAIGVVASAMAQDSTPEPNQIGRDTSQQDLREVSVDRFEDPGFWVPAIPSDRGLVMHRRLNGSPADKEPIPGEEELGIVPSDENVIGMRVDFYRRGDASVSLVPTRPIAVPGIVKTISLWVVGRNFNHNLSIVVEDFFGNQNTLPFGTLNFSGWKRLTVAVPPTIVQRSPYYNTDTGLLIRGLVIDANMEEAFGTYYVYFDDLRAVTDLFAEESRDADDMVDGWGW